MNIFLQTDLILDRITLSKVTPDMWQDHHLSILDEFAGDTQHMLVAYIDSVNGLTLDFSVPCGPVNELVYFLKKENVTSLSVDTFFRDVLYGTVTGRHIESLLRVMSGIYVPVFYKNTTWPDSIKNDFTGQLHKFMASLTDTRWKMEGKTVLYIPLEGTVVRPEVASKNKELIQRLES